MNPTETTPNQYESNDEKYLIPKAFRKIMLASIGVLSIAQDEFEELVRKLVEHGELAEIEGRKIVDHLKEERGKHFRSREELFKNKLEEFVDQMKIPTKDDLNSLNKRVAALTKKVDALLKMKVE